MRKLALLFSHAATAALVAAPVWAQTMGPVPAPLPGQIPGTTTNDNASAGNVGEYVSSSIALGSAVGLTTNQVATVTSVSLTAGDWDCRGNVGFNPAITTVMSNEVGQVNSAASFATAPGGGSTFVGNITYPAGVGGLFPVGAVRISLASSGTAYLLAQATFTTSTNAAYGFLGCRRMR